MGQEELVKALNHPVRVKALTILTERTASPTEISDQIGVPLSHVSNHVRVLDELGLIEIVGEEPVRGAVKHFYKAVERPLLDTAEWEQLSPHVRTAVSAYALETVMKDAAKSLGAGLFDAREERHLTRTPLLLDEKGWQKVNAILTDALGSVLDEQAASAARMNDSEEEGIPVIAAIACFEVPKKG
ncbi:MAG TPA: helix-turn-helix domain-containing protein [Solirubrobacterales bacterium]|nr:helix-turn-helix domain-containing protein [Solirubrobacterales bacterium]